MEAVKTRRLVLLSAAAVAVVASLALQGAGAAAEKRISLERAEAAARKAVLEHASYRRITSTRGGLVTRSCWRAKRSRVRCSLYAVAPNPCALDGRSDGVCAQALWERRWLVEVRRGRHAPAARILKISSGPSRSV